MYPTHNVNLESPRYETGASTATACASRAPIAKRRGSRRSGTARSTLTLCAAAGPAAARRRAPTWWTGIRTATSQRSGWRGRTYNGCLVLGLRLAPIPPLHRRNTDGVLAHLPGPARRGRLFVPVYSRRDPRCNGRDCMPYFDCAPGFYKLFGPTGPSIARNTRACCRRCSGGFRVNSWPTIPPAA